LTSTRSPTQTPAEAGQRRVTLLWRVFLANAAVLVAVYLLLALAPVTVSVPVSFDELLVLSAGLLAMLGLNLLLLRRVLSPIRRLTRMMTSVDPDRPGRRLSGVAPYAAEATALADAFNDMLDRLETARRDAARTALRAQEAERLRVARELHDEIGQTLTAITMQAERAADGDPAMAPAELERVADAVRLSLDEVRRIARELRPEALDDLGLVNALIALCSRVDAQPGLRVTRQLEGIPALPPDAELVIYRVAQEGLTNVVRHAGAATATVSLVTDAETVVLSVRDDGVGMPAETASGTAGIAGMRERALLMDGRLSIRSEPGNGTEVRLEVPFDGEAR
jgi:two-component system sensor histidine kinase UhpB